MLWELLAHDLMVAENLVAMGSLARTPNISLVGGMTCIDGAKNHYDSRVGSIARDRVCLNTSFHQSSSATNGA